MRSLSIGKKNDATVYANWNSTGTGLWAMSSDNLIFGKPDFTIKCDSGAYPGVTDFEDYICKKAYEEHIK